MGIFPFNSDNILRVEEREGETEIERTWHFVNEITFQWMSPSLLEFVKYRRDCRESEKGNMRIQLDSFKLGAPFPFFHR